MSISPQRRALVIGLSKAGNGANMMATPMGGSVATIKNVIENDMLIRVEDAHNENQAELDKLGSDAQSSLVIEYGDVRLPRHVVLSY